MKFFKVLWLFVAFILSFFISIAQAQRAGYNAFQTDIEHVIMDYPSSFQHYIGDELVKSPQSTDYSSLLKIRGSEECRIIKYPSQKKSAYSFQSVLLTTEDFTTAKDKYSDFYGQLTNLSVRVASQTLVFKGNYESPDETKGFASTVFTTVTEDPSAERLKMELVIAREVATWKIKLLVYKKDQEGNEPPTVSAR